MRSIWTAMVTLTFYLLPSLTIKSPGMKTMEMKIFLPYHFNNSEFSRRCFAIDLDGDGDIDVLSASNNDNKIAWYENNGFESFTPHTITTNAMLASSAYAIDLDGDGDIDVLSHLGLMAK